MKITQEHIDANVADIEEFWDCFHNMLKAPYAYWRDFSSKTRQEWIDACWASSNILKGVNKLKEYPVLKGEGIVVTDSTGDQILTNYRYLYGEGNSLINIPLHNLLHYDIVTDADDTRQDLKIQYLRNGKEETLRIDSWIKDELVRSVRDAGEFENLNAEQKAILETSHYELSKIGINAPVIGLLPKTPEKGCFDNNKKS